jgi:Ca-activated chloride channel family protein
MKRFPAVMSGVLAAVLTVGGLLLPLPQQGAWAQITGNVDRDAASASAAASAPENVLIILDASYSMAEPLPGGETKMNAAKRVILETLKSFPATTNVGFRVYGTSDSPFNACRASQLLVPFGTNNRNVIASKLVGLKPTGATPITHTLMQAVNQDFAGVQGKKSIILISDGMETCDADPCRAAVQMVRGGVDTRINVVGFGLREYDPAAEKQLKCVALSTLGKYYSAETAAQLGESLRNAVRTEATVQGRILVPGSNTQAPPVGGR